MTITNDTQQLLVNNQQIRPTEPLESRAIGRLWGKYVPSSELIYQGQLITADGVMLETNLAKRASKLVQQSQLDLSVDYLWTVYPRTPFKDSPTKLRVTLINVRKEKEYTDSVKSELQLVADNFSVQGLVIYQDYEFGIVLVKIHQKPQREFEPPKDFQLRLIGFLPSNSIHKFWNFNVRRVGTSLVIQSGECIKLQEREQSSTSDISTSTAGYTTELTES
ncbi:hypothetical protein [Nostoc sp. 'Peltigera membranacea cyanobiont' 232]|uniref:hypothetical protein n=1 Tax=Nostoc sp. 'Peltigera membranacea cyanobiont' 232 TaxID=2014531 RepID=UPI000B95BB64|nr:hypothetical protein [Nostoc sp. 'Peltigera membranacea cyanobiont' 232]OYE02808.1 hypothetical protein CDG79_22035 [Nostoc sp. 'Peltigera membranacea cyanobiont' 232]